MTITQKGCYDLLKVYWPEIKKDAIIGVMRDSKAFICVTGGVVILGSGYKRFISNTWYD